MSCLLSLVVITKDRYEYLEFFIQMICRIQGEEWELIIQDNTDDNKRILDYLNILNNNQIKYYHIKEPVSVKDNADIGIQNASGKYVCLMGDDDVVSSHILEFVKYMDREEIEAAIFNKAFFIWKGVNFFFKFPALRVPDFTNKITYLSPSEERRKVLRRGGTMLGKMPTVYQAIVKKECMNQARRESGSYFPGASPDMASAVMNSYFVEKLIYCDIPVISIGQSPKSVVGTTGRHGVNNVSEVPFLPSDIQEKWDKKIPYIWTSTTIFAESFIESVKSLNREKDLINLNIPYLYGEFLVRHFEYRGLLKETAKQNKIKLIFVYLYACLFFLKRCKVFMSNLLITKMKKGIIYASNEVNDNVEASELIDREIFNRWEKT